MVVLTMVALYLLAGFVFSLVFVLVGIKKVDPDAQGSRLGFRLIIIPGLCVFWPHFLLKWIKK